MLLYNAIWKFVTMVSAHVGEMPVTWGCVEHNSALLDRFVSRYGCVCAEPKAGHDNDVPEATADTDCVSVKVCRWRLRHTQNRSLQKRKYSTRSIFHVPSLSCQPKRHTQFLSKLEIIKSLADNSKWCRLFMCLK